MENFITKIFIQKSRNIENFEIPLSETTRQHLILTGKNGSGKTSLLQEISIFLDKVGDGSIVNYDGYYNSITGLKELLDEGHVDPEIKYKIIQSLKDVEKSLAQFGGTKLHFSGSQEELFEKAAQGTFLLAFFDAKRHQKLSIPNGVKKVELKPKYKIGERASEHFIQYIVNLKADRSFAKDDNELETVAKIDAWFERLENRLKYIFNAQSLDLRFDRKTYNFDLVINEDEILHFNTLSDGYSAIISIVTEILLRMEAQHNQVYDLEGIVLIDEIETHLHVDLQKKILPFLTDFFPKIQFIVSTHSPFVLSSLSNATICDLESRIITQDLSSYSYDALVESYFDTDKYSEEVNQKVRELEQLVSLRERNAEQNDQLRVLKKYFDQIPQYLSNDELVVKLQQIKLKELSTKK
jgi:predicted ATP-dependent endonuclease of OLD family